MRSASESLRAQLTPQERTTKIDKVLQTIISNRGVTAAALVDSDGLVTHVRREFELNTDAVGAAVQIALGSARRASDHLVQGTTNLLLVENKDGFLMLAPLHRGLILALVADTSALLGQVRFELKQTIHELDQLF